MRRWEADAHPKLGQDGSAFVCRKCSWITYSAVTWADLARFLGGPTAPGRPGPACSPRPQAGRCRPPEVAAAGPRICRQALTKDRKASDAYFPKKSYARATTAFARK